MSIIYHPERERPYEVRVKVNGKTQYGGMFSEKKDGDWEDEVTHWMPMPELPIISTPDTQESES